MKMTTIEILQILEELFPDAHCELDYKDLYQLSVAVILSAQTTDVSVNKVTPQLFVKYPDLQALANAKVEEVENLIRNIGLYRNKAKNIMGFSNAVLTNFNGVIPNTLEELIQLPGVGRKTANVILSEFYKIPAIAVDTHVERVSKRLGLAKPNDNVLQVEKSLQKKIPKELWSKAHHLLIFFGRYQCKAQKPECESCPFIEICTKKKNVSSK